RTQVTQRARHLVELAERQLEESSRQGKVAPSQVRGEVIPVAEVADGSQIYTRVTGARHLVEHGVAIGNVGHDPDGQLERPVADRGIGDHDVTLARHDRWPGAAASAGSDGLSRRCRL